MLLVNILFALSPFVVVWMAVTIMKYGKYNGHELGENEEWGYQDVNKRKYLLMTGDNRLWRIGQHRTCTNGMPRFIPRKMSNTAIPAIINGTAFLILPP